MLCAPPGEDNQVASTNNREALVLGIDTGGTYTDGVLLEYYSRRVLASHKSLTTKRDFSIGIEDVIENIHIEDPSAIRMVSISTTLATNAIAEGKGKRVALLLIGYDPELVSSFRMEQQFATPNFTYFQGGHDLYGSEKAELDLPGILAKVNEVKAHVDAFAISAYFSPLNPEHELRAYEAVSRICDHPIVLGHQLSTKLGSVERATTAALNASMLAVLQDFIIAVRQAMERRRIDAPLMVVRGDGTLMSDEFAARSPVETIHSGPAASAIGARFLSGEDDALVLDIGGTTTDYALVSGGAVEIAEEGASVSGYKTAVKAARLLSIGIGGDSHIKANSDREILIGPQRVVPLSYLAFQHDEVLVQLRSLARRSWSGSGPEWLEYWYLLREPHPDSDLLDDTRTHQMIELLRDGPLPVPQILQKLRLLHVRQSGVGELLRQEIIGQAGLTPTDLLHAEGIHTPWCVEAAERALHVFGKHLLAEPDEVVERVHMQMTEAIVRSLINFLSDNTLPPNAPRGDMGEWFFQNGLYATHPHLETRIRLRYPIIGIGAPAAEFLQPVADVLHTDLLLPEYYHVANAVGAIAGSVMVNEEVLVYPRLGGGGIDVVGYYVQSGQGRDHFEEAHDALAFARERAHELALSAALRSGAENPQVRVEEVLDGIDTYRVRARAFGNPRLAG